MLTANFSGRFFENVYTFFKTLILLIEFVHSFVWVWSAHWPMTYYDEHLQAKRFTTGHNTAPKVTMMKRRGKSEEQSGQVGWTGDQRAVPDVEWSAVSPHCCRTFTVMMDCTLELQAKWTLPQVAFVRAMQTATNTVGVCFSAHGGCADLATDRHIDFMAFVVWPHP